MTADIDGALLAVSELVTNALVHTGGQVRLGITLVNDRLRLAVVDASPRTPVKPTSIGWEATGGGGILLVEAVSATWGTLPAGGGKQVWAEFALRPWRSPGTPAPGDPTAPPGIRDATGRQSGETSRDSTRATP